MGTSASNHETIKSVNECKCCGRQYWVRFEREYFEKGGCRYAFRGTYYGGGKHDGEQCVSKVFIDKVAKLYVDWVPDIAAAEKANELAMRFNRAHPTNRPIKFVIPLIAKMDFCGQTGGFLWFSEEDKRYVKSDEYVAIEPFIYGHYQKFNSNSGAVFALTESLPAFSHFTYVASDRELVVCDLQGVRNDDHYYLTDPAICSRDQLYGPTDLGTAGIANFFARHHCTAICKSFPRPEVDSRSRVRALQPKKGSSYTFELTRQHDQINREFRARKTLPAITE
ncbi:myosin heavy chain kinase D-like [Convolutriloba macropyga]|uniref:myosin heavy chain kinase D-like n=1 Tax=Convolutriloba macropyga TaxID=536237 RepID=UPI003F525C9F